MTRPPYRPWGLLPWVVRHSSASAWSFLGCLGTEERSLAAWSLLKSLAGLAHVEFIRIADKPSHYSNLTNYRISARTDQFRASGGNDSSVRDEDLFAPSARIVKIIDDFIEHASGCVIVDVTSLPKRFFFPMIRRIMTSDRRTNIESVVITYSIPREYPPRVNLAENFDDWAHLPLFSGGYSSSPPEMLVIGVGFQVLGLHEHLKGESGLPIKLLLPFPAPPPAFMRSWELRRQLERHGSPENFEVFRAGARDASDTFDRLVSLTRNGQSRCALAPFGPKPMSLGMCIFATLADCEVFYTQPSVYHPDYSLGTSFIDGSPEVYGYCLRIAGRDLYSL